MKLSLFFFSLMNVLSVEGQSSLNSTKTNLYFEIGGAGFTSINIERQRQIAKEVKVYARAGLGFYPSKLGIFGQQTELSGVLPIMLGFNFGKGNASLETGFGLTLGLDDSRDVNGGKSNTIKWIDGTIGFRYQRPDRKFLFRAGYTPWITFSKQCLDTNCTLSKDQMKILPMVGLSFGASVRGKKEK
jgi:hypothetical protein